MTESLIRTSGLTLMLSANQSNQDYTSYSIYDLDRDSFIDIGDLAVMSSSWLQAGRQA